MNSSDVTTILNWIIPGIIGLIVGIISTFLAHRYQKERDRISWEREKEKLREQFQNEKEIYLLQYQLRLSELKQKSEEQQSSNLREQLTKGVDNPAKALNELRESEISLSESHYVGSITDLQERIKKLTTEYFEASFRAKRIIVAIMLLLVLAIIIIGLIFFFILR